MRALTVAAIALSALAGCGGPPEADIGEVERVLVVALPGVSWRDVDAGVMPNLDAFSEHAAVGNLATRVGRGRADTAGAYLTMGAGTRALAPEQEAGLAVEAAEQVNGIAAAELLQRRLGETPTGMAYLPAGPTRDANDDTVFGAEIGLLGDRLQAAGIARAVVANGDLADEVTDVGPPGDLTTLRREAATLLMGSDGLVPAGAISADLLVADPASPYGVRLDPRAVVDSFTGTWGEASGPASGARSVVLVEASDLHRVAAYEPSTTETQRAAIGRRALAASDDLLGRLLRHVDPERDAVLVLGVPTEPGDPDLGVAALRSPAVDDGLLRSATTGRDGYVQLADVAPAAAAGGVTTVVDGAGRST
jgi:hypothetical protein